MKIHMCLAETNCLYFWVLSGKPVKISRRFVALNTCIYNMERSIYYNMEIYVKCCKSLNTHIFFSRHFSQHPLENCRQRPCKWV